MWLNEIIQGAPGAHVLAVQIKMSEGQLGAAGNAAAEAICVQFAVTEAVIGFGMICNNKKCGFCFCCW